MVLFREKRESKTLSPLWELLTTDGEAERKNVLDGDLFTFYLTKYLKVAFYSL